MGRKMKLDFTGVESYLRASEGVHVCKIATADEKPSQSGNDMIVVAFEVIKGDDKGARVYENYSLMDTALWKLKGLLQAIGMKADGKVQLDLDKLVGKICQVTVKHEEYEGKTRARVDSTNKYSAAAADDEDTDSEDDEEDVEEEQEEVKPKKAEKKPTPKKAPIPEPEDEEDGEDDEEDDDWEDEEEEEKPAPKKKSKPESKPEKKSEKKSDKKKKSDDDEDDDWEDGDWEE